VAFLLTATLTVTAGSASPLSYQWYSGAAGDLSAPIFGATSSSYTTAPMMAPTSLYWVRVTNSYGSVNSSTATVTVPVVSNRPDLEDQVLILINQQRAAGATCGSTVFPPAGPLVMNDSLRTSARGHSTDMATLNFFSHVSLDGRTFVQRIQNAGYTQSGNLGENIASGFTTAEGVVNAWVMSEEHCVNLMNGSYKSTGIGYAFGMGTQYGSYWTQDFGGS